jgi:hypothetical protein
LHHLVVSAAALLNVAITETDGDVIDKLRDLKAFQAAVAAMPGDERFFLGM